MLKLSSQNYISLCLFCVLPNPTLFGVGPMHVDTLAQQLHTFFNKIKYNILIQHLTHIPNVHIRLSQVL